MPIATSLVLSQLRDTNYTRTLIPYFPNNEWRYGRLLINDYGPEYKSEGILAIGDYPGSNITIVASETERYVQIITNTNMDDEARIYGGYQNFNSYLFPRCKINFQLVDNANLLYFVGFADIANYTEDDFLTNQDGFGLVVLEDGNFQITSNDGSITSYYTSDIDTIDTDIHSLYLESDYTNSRWGYKLDDGPLTYISTQNPRFDYSMDVIAVAVTKEGGIGKTHRLHDMQAWQKVR